jgi:HSP20 family protein
MLVKFDRSPLSGSLFLDLENEINSLLSGFTARNYGGSPAVRVAENDLQYELLFEVPGVAREDLKISVEDGVLQISGTRTSVTLPEKATWLRNEISNGKFSRTLQLPAEVKVGEVSAELTDGILRVVLPKAEVAQPREISVQ